MIPSVIDKLVKHYNFLKQKLQLVEEGKWQEDVMLRNASVAEIETLRSLVRELEDLGIRLMSKLQKRKVN